MATNGLIPAVSQHTQPGMEWKDSPVFKGSTKFEPLQDVQNIMITGGAGFIASWLVRHLTLTYPEYKVVSFDKIDYCATLNNSRILDNASNFVFQYGNVTDIKEVMRCIKDHKIDTIFHLAAQSHVDLSFGNSFEFTKTNVEGTHIMVESAVKLGVKRFIHISTDEVNGEVNHGDPDLLEDSLLAPTNPYAASKAAAEMYVNAYAKSFQLPAIIIRSNNVYGPHQYPEKIIPKFASLLDRNRPLILHGDGTNTRRYLYAGDAADAFDTILHRGQIGEIYNVGSRDEISNSDLAHKILDAFDISPDKHGSYTQHVKDRPFNDKRYAVDAGKLRGLGWEQKTPFETGLKITVDWYRKFGRTWWGDVESVLTAFPELREGDLYDPMDPRKPAATPSLEMQMQMENGHGNGHRNGSGNGLLAPIVQNVGDGNVMAEAAPGPAKKKRGREVEGKENMDVGDGSAGNNKRVALGEELSGRKSETVR